MSSDMSSGRKRGLDQERLIREFSTARGWRQNSGSDGWKKKTMRRLVYPLIVVLLIGTSVMAGLDWGPFHNSGTPSNGNPAPVITTGATDLVGEYPPYVDEGADIQLDNVELVDKVGPAVVSIVSESVSYNWLYQPVPQTGAGTGVIISPDGWMVTNNHVVEGASKLTVTLSDGRSFQASRVTTDPQTDLAVVRIDASDLPYLHLLNNSLEQLHELEPVVAVGNALAYEGGPTWTTGVVSNLGRSIEFSDGRVLYDLIQTDAAINPGNSGGPLVNMAGQVVGINVAIASNAENIGFAISTDTAIPVIRSLIEEGQIVRPRLGVTMTTVTPTLVNEYDLSIGKGVLVLNVFEGSPAEEAGLMPGDVVANIGGQEVNTSEEMRVAIQSHNVGDDIEITYFRGDEQRTTTATLVQAVY